MQALDLRVDGRTVLGVGWAPVVQVAAVGEPMGQPVGYGEAAAALELRQHYYHLAVEKEQRDLFSRDG